MLTVVDLPMALSVIAAVGRQNLALPVDTMRIERSGSTAADLAAITPQLI